MTQLPVALERLELCGLPLCDLAEVEHATGSLRFVRGAVGIPLTTFGVLATAAAALTGSVLATAAAAATTGLIVVSILGDTRLSRALERLRRGDLNAAREGMKQVARMRGPGRQRAESYLALIAWSTGEHAEALRWTRARQESLAALRGPDDERFLTRASEALLVALLGQGRTDAELCRDLGEPPPGARYTEAWGCARLAHAFLRDDIEPLRRDLAAWHNLYDDLNPFSGALFAWGLARAGRQQLARMVLERSVVGRSQAVALHSPSLADWCERFETQSLPYRSGF